MSDDRNTEIAKIILHQMGGAARLHTMIGANGYLVGDKSLSFMFKGCRKAKKVIITLNHLDLYEMRIGKLNRDYDWIEIYNADMLYADMLIPQFEKATGLRLSL